MWKSIKQEFYVQRTLLRSVAIVSTGAWIFGVLIMTVVLRLMRGVEEEYFCLGTVLGLLICVILDVFVGASVIYQGFNDAVYMGKTRKRFLPAAALVIFAASLISLFIVGILNRVELILYRNLFPSLINEVNFGSYLAPGWILCYASTLTGLACAAGGIIKASGRIGGSVCLVLWITMCWSVGGIGGVDKESRGFFKVFEGIGFRVGTWFAGLEVWMRMSFLCLLGAAGFTLMYLLLIRKEAT